MPSEALTYYYEVRAKRFEFFEDVHQELGGETKGRRALGDVTRALTYLLAAEFQGYCRDVVCEATQFIASCVIDNSSQELREMVDVLSGGAATNLRIDVGNPRFDALVKDFRRIGVKDLRASVKNRKIGRVSGAERIKRVEAMLNVRNAVVHGNEEQLRYEFPSGYVTLTTVREWRTNVTKMAVLIDEIVFDTLDDVCHCSPDWK